MGKLMDALEEQMKTEAKEDAEKCIKIYNAIKENSGGKVWKSCWSPLVRVEFIGVYPNTKRRYTPTGLGQLFLKRIEQ